MKTTYEMAEAIISSPAWDGTAKTAEELMEYACGAEIAEELMEKYACGAEIMDLYAEMSIAEDELNDAIDSGELVLLPDGTYQRTSDGAII